MHLPGYQNIQIQAFSIGVTSFPLSEGKKTEGWEWTRTGLGPLFSLLTDMGDIFGT